MPDTEHNTEHELSALAARAAGLPTATLHANILELTALLQALRDALDAAEHDPASDPTRAFTALERLMPIADCYAREAVSRRLAN